jgi:hypothetical protein
MRAFKKLLLLAAICGVSMSSFSAGSETTQPMTGELLVRSGKATLTRNVEYCLRNMPELTEQFVEAHASYSRAATDAAVILERQFPASKFTIYRARIETSPKTAAEIDLRVAHSRGFNLLCPEIVAYMRKATGESLAQEYGNLLTSLQKQFSSP